jgi:hypothetical protein
VRECRKTRRRREDKEEQIKPKETEKEPRKKSRKNKKTNKTKNTWGEENKREGIKRKREEEKNRSQTMASPTTPDITMLTLGNNNNENELDREIMALDDGIEQGQRYIDQFKDANDQEVQERVTQTKKVVEELVAKRKEFMVHTGREMKEGKRKREKTKTINSKLNFNYINTTGHEKEKTSIGEIDSRTGSSSGEEGGGPTNEWFEQSATNGLIICEKMLCRDILGQLLV